MDTITALTFSVSATAFALTTWWAMREVRRAIEDIQARLAALESAPKKRLGMYVDEDGTPWSYVGRGVWINELTARTQYGRPS